MISVLFVDDDDRVLDALRLALDRREGRWQLHFALGPAEARIFLKGVAFDVVVTDLSMDGVDGLSLLDEVRRIQPGAARIILSSDVDERAALQAAQVAHAVLRKPVIVGELDQALDRVVKIRRILEDEELRRAAHGVVALPAMPSLYEELLEVFGRPGSSAADVAYVIERDPAMSAKVLQLVNSAFFGIARRVTDVKQAVALLGYGVMRALVLSTQAFTLLGDGIDARWMEGFQRHAALVARLAGAFADPDEQDDAVAAGLLHDIGRLLLAVEGRLDESHERHAAAGAYLLGLWGLPHTVVEAIAFHHTPEVAVESQGLGLVGAVHLAEAMAAEIEGRSPTLATGWLDQRGLGSSVSGWRATATELGTASDD